MPLTQREVGRSLYGCCFKQSGRNGFRNNTCNRRFLDHSLVLPIHVCQVDKLSDLRLASRLVVREWQQQRKVVKNGATTSSRINLSGYAGHVTIECFTAACCAVVYVRFSVGFSVWLVSGYAHVFLLLSVVIVTLPPAAVSLLNCRLYIAPFRLPPLGSVMHCLTMSFQHHSLTQSGTNWKLCYIPAIQPLLARYRTTQRPW